MLVKWRKYIVIINAYRRTLFMGTGEGVDLQRYYGEVDKDNS